MKKKRVTQKSLQPICIDENNVIRLHEPITHNATKMKGKIEHATIVNGELNFTVLLDDGRKLFAMKKDVTFDRPEAASAVITDYALMKRM